LVPPQGVRGTGGDRLRRQILATLGGQLETALDQLGPCRHVGCDNRIRDTSCQAKYKHREKQVRRKTTSSKKKSKAPALLYQLCRPYFPENLDLILIDGATLLVRARAPPETWTTRLEPCDQPEPTLVDYLFSLVIIFGNDCSKFEQSAK
jgi:hypothetical protein